MSGATAAAWTMAAVTAAAAGASVYSAEKQNKQAKKAAAQQKEASDKALTQQIQDTNRQNKRQADVSGLLDANTAEGLGNTSLTGAQGAPIDPAKLGGGSGLLGG